MYKTGVLMYNIPFIYNEYRSPEQRCFSSRDLYLLQNPLSPVDLCLHNHVKCMDLGFSAKEQEMHFISFPQILQEQQFGDSNILPLDD